MDLRLDIIDRVRGFNLESDSFSGKSLYEDLHTKGFGSKSASTVCMSKEDNIHISDNLIMTHKYMNISRRKMKKLTENEPHCDDCCGCGEER